MKKINTGVKLYRVEEARNKNAKRWRRVNVGPKFATKEVALDVARTMRKIHEKRFYYRIRPWIRKSRR